MSRGIVPPETALDPDVLFRRAGAAWHRNPRSHRRIPLPLVMQYVDIEGSKTKRIVVLGGQGMMGCIAVRDLACSEAWMKSSSVDLNRENG